jgi:hypothetical protein
MEVHAPEHPIMTWRQFFIHIGTITVGLLIAIGLEQAVEYLHHRHQLHVAEHNLQIELEANRKTLAADQEQLRGSAGQLLGILASIKALRAHHPAKLQPTQWSWSDLQEAAWDTARNTGATTFMSYPEAQELADRYTQQQLVNAQANAYIHSVYALSIRFATGEKPEDLTPADLDREEEAVFNALAELGHLQALCNGQEMSYKNAGSH